MSEEMKKRELDMYKRAIGNGQLYFASLRLGI